MFETAETSGAVIGGATLAYHNPKAVKGCCADGLPTERAWKGSGGLQIVATGRPSIAPFILMTACDVHPMLLPVLSLSGALGIAICLP